MQFFRIWAQFRNDKVSLCTTSCIWELRIYIYFPWCSNTHQTSDLRAFRPVDARHPQPALHCFKSLHRITNFYITWSAEVKLTFHNRTTNTSCLLTSLQVTYTERINRLFHTQKSDRRRKLTKDQCQWQKHGNGKKSVTKAGAFIMNGELLTP